ncbi:EcsC family protein [Shouchella sp. JSM 1781072]|uniref:EcsC family protein n=1 Tax=Bacillaceae TaxID=186817 RepID=UPI000C069593|nr:EcsC family protein [Bacillus sp. Marseille-P3800]
MTELERWQEELHTYERRLKKRAKKERNIHNVDNLERWTQTVDPFMIQFYEWFQADRLQPSVQTGVKLESTDTVADCLEKEQLLHKDLARLRLYGLAQGGTSMYSTTTILTQIPAVLYLTRKAIDKIRYFYQFQEKGETAEAILSLRLFLYTYLPDYAKYEEWESLKVDSAYIDESEPMYVGKEDILSETIVIQMLKQVTRMYMYKHLTEKKFPLKRLVLGTYQATLSYRHMQTVTEDAQMFYRKRWLANNQANF